MARDVMGIVSDLASSVGHLGPAEGLRFSLLVLADRLAGGGSSFLPPGIPFAAILSDRDGLRRVMMDADRQRRQPSQELIIYLPRAQLDLVVARSRYRTDRPVLTARHACALLLVGTNAFATIDFPSIRRVAVYLELYPGWIEAEMKAVVGRALEHWPQEAPIPLARPGRMSCGAPRSPWLDDAGRRRQVTTSDPAKCRGSSGLARAGSLRPPQAVHPRRSDLTVNPTVRWTIVGLRAFTGKEGGRGGAAASIPSNCRSDGHCPVGRSERRQVPGTI